MHNRIRQIIGSAAVAGVLLAAGAAGAQAAETEEATAADIGTAVAVVSDDVAPETETANPFDGFLSDEDAEYAEELAAEAHENEAKAAAEWAEANATGLAE
jgi:hypothetical protein